MRERLQHLAAVEDIPSVNEPEFTRWADTRLDRWLVDWALRTGKEKTARMIAEDRGIEVCFSLDTCGTTQTAHELLQLYTADAMSFRHSLILRNEPIRAQSLHLLDIE